MDHAIRAGEPATGAHTITVEKHKNNFISQYGTFEDKESQNVARWLNKADHYQEAHMIQSLEMGSIVIHCIKGEPERKVRRMLDVPGANYVNANHYSPQPIQQAQPYTPYRPGIPAGNWPDLIPAEGFPYGALNAGQPHPFAGQAHDEIQAQPQLDPVRFQPQVLQNACLRAYLLGLYEKRVNLAEAEKFLQTFKTQKPRQTCSNYLDEFIISYENYAHMKWTLPQLNGTPAVAEVQAQAEVPAQPEVPANNGNPLVAAVPFQPAVAHVPARAAMPGNQDLREADKLQLISNGICKEFKMHCDNIEFDITNTTIPELENRVQNWQRNTTTGKQFTANCLPPSSNRHAMASSAISEDQNTTSMENLSIHSTPQQSSTASARGQRRGNGNRRGFMRGRGINRARNASSNVNVGIQNPTQSIQSKDMNDGGYNNYRQTREGILIRNNAGHLLCDYCSGPSHKRERCSLKEADRKAGIRRIYHPNRERNTPTSSKAKVATVELSKDQFITPEMASAAIPQIQYPWPYPMIPFQPQPLPAQWAQPFKPQEQPMEMDINKSQNVAAATFSATMGSPCPYTPCNARLSDPHATQEHIRQFHNHPTLATGPVFNP